MRNKNAIYITIAAATMLYIIFLGGNAGIYLFALAIAAGIIRLITRLSANINLLSQRKRERQASSELPVKIVALLMGIFFLSGTLIYIYTFKTISDGIFVRFNNFECILRSMICSLDLFMLDVDSNILDRLDMMPGLKGCIMIQAVLSFSCTIAILLGLVLSRARAYFRLHKLTRITAQKNHLYLFFGIDEASRLLANDVRNSDPEAIIIFIDKANMHDDDSDGWKNIVELITHRRGAFITADEIDANIAIITRQFCDLDSDKIDEYGSDIFDIVGLTKIKELIEDLKKYPSDAKLQIFFMSDDEDNNLRDLITLTKDMTIIDAVNNKINTKFYCHARLNESNRTVQDISVKKNLDVSIVDSSHLAVESLKSDINNHPVNVVTIDSEHPTMVSSDLDCLIVGFGEVGRDMFRFLYEYGAFVDAKSTPEHVRRSKFTCTAIDNRMDEIKGAMLASMPAIAQNTHTDETELEFLNTSCDDETFFNSILSPERAKTINYIVLALNDNDKNISLASQIFNYIRRYRETMDNLLIMVRCTNEDKKEIMQRIADHYNNGFSEKNHSIIRLFGMPEKVYSYDMIIHESILNGGIKFFKSYSGQRGTKETWEERHKSLTTSGKNGNPVLDKLRRLHRQENQDISNMLHAGTKIYLLKKALGENYNWDDFMKRYFDESGKAAMSGSFSHITYNNLTDKENNTVLNLAILEHTRWNASHELLGYVKADGNLHMCDERTQQHNCLITWEELDNESEKASSPEYIADYKSFDFVVVNTTISLFKDSLKEKQD